MLRSHMMGRSWRHLDSILIIASLFTISRKYYRIRRRGQVPMTSLSQSELAHRQLYWISNSAPKTIMSSLLASTISPSSRSPDSVSWPRRVSVGGRIRSVLSFVLGSSRNRLSLGHSREICISGRIMLCRIRSKRIRHRYTRFTRGKGSLG